MLLAYPPKRIPEASFITKSNVYIIVWIVHYFHINNVGVDSDASSNSGVGST